MGLVLATIPSRLQVLQRGEEDPDDVVRTDPSSFARKAVKSLEYQITKRLGEWGEKSKHFNIFYTSPSSVEHEMMRGLAGDMQFFGLAMLVMAVYCARTLARTVRGGGVGGPRDAGAPNDPTSSTTSSWLTSSWLRSKNGVDSNMKKIADSTPTATTPSGGCPPPQQSSPCTNCCGCFGVGARPLSAATGIVSVLFATLAGLALLGMLLGVELNSSLGFLPFLLLGIGVDDMFLIVHTVDELDIAAEEVSVPEGVDLLEERIGIFRINLDCGRTMK